MRKVILIIVILIIAAGLIGGAVIAIRRYFPQRPPAETEDGGLPPETAAVNKLTTISPEPIFDYWFNSKTNEVYYLSLKGGIFKITDGEVEQVGSHRIERPYQVKASPDGTRAIFGFGYPQETVFSIFDTAKNSWTPLPIKTTAAAWDPTSQQVAYLKNGDTGSALEILSLSGNKSRRVVSLAVADVDLSWPSANEIYFQEKPTVTIGSSLWKLDINKKTIAPVIENEAGLMINWSSSGGIGLKFTTALAGSDHFLDLINKDNVVVAILDLITLPSKCAWASKNLYCAFPKTILPRTELPDDYLKGKLFFDDRIMLLEVDKLSQTPYLPIIIWDDKEIKIDAERLSIINNELLFINRYDQKLYRLPL